MAKFVGTSLSHICFKPGKLVVARSVFRCRPTRSRPSAPLVVSEPGFLLEVAVIALDAPAHFGKSVDGMRFIASGKRCMFVSVP